MHFDIFHGPQDFTSLPTMKPFPQTIKLQLVFYYHFRKTLWCMLLCLRRIPKSHTDNHNMTELLYHSIILLRVSKGLDYWWIDCGCVRILAKWTCHASRTFIFYLCLYSVWMMNYNIFTVETLAAVQSRCPCCWFHGDEPQQILLVTKDVLTLGNSFILGRAGFFTTECLVCDHGVHCMHVHML